jgi:hypothetical protein
MTDEIDKIDKSFLSEDDEREIKESIKETEANQQTFNRESNSNKREGSIVKGKVSMVVDGFGVEDFPEKKEEVAFHLALALDDEESIAYYKKLAKERRNDFLKNCLKITLEGNKNNKIKTTKAKYFTGIVKARTLQQERIEAYKRKYYLNKR